MHRFHKYHFPKLSELFIIKALKLLCLSLPARMKLLAMKSTPPCPIFPPFQRDYQFVVCVKGTHNVLFLPGLTIQFKKAIKRRLAALSDPIVAVMGIRIKTNKTELGIYSLLRL